MTCEATRARATEFKLKAQRPPHHRYYYFCYCNYCCCCYAYYYDHHHNHHHHHHHKHLCFQPLTQQNSAAVNCDRHVSQFALETSHLTHHTSRVMHASHVTCIIRSSRHTPLGRSWREVLLLLLLLAVRRCNGGFGVGGRGRGYVGDILATAAPAAAAAASAAAAAADGIH